jgi:hypothetical protein
MNNNPREYRSVIWTYIVILLGVAIGGLGLLLLIWKVLAGQGIVVEFWTFISSISGFFTAAAVFGGGFIAYHTLSESSNSRYLAVANQLFEELNSKEQINARRMVYQNLSTDPAQSIPALSAELRDAFKVVLNSLDRVAFLTQHGWIPLDLIMPWAHPMIAKSWIKLKPYVEYERKRRKEPYYYQHAEAIGEVCLEWRKKNAPELEDVNWVNDAL